MRTLEQVIGQLRKMQPEYPIRHAFGNGSAWRQVPPIVQYAVMAEKGLVI
jgi:hypothetical protein